MIIITYRESNEQYEEVVNEFKNFFGSFEYNYDESVARRKAEEHYEAQVARAEASPNYANVTWYETPGAKQFVATTCKRVADELDTWEEEYEAEYGESPYGS